MNCPICKADMQETTIGNLTLDTCSNCGGVWFEYGEMSTVKELKPEEVELIEMNKKSIQKTENTSYKCPKCNAGLKQTQYDYSSGIWIDRCEQCKGVFVDKGELKKLSEYFASFNEWDDEIDALRPKLAQVKVDVELAFEKIKQEVDDLYVMDDLHKKGHTGKLFKRMKDLLFIHKYF